MEDTGGKISTSQSSGSALRRPNHHACRPTRMKQSRNEIEPARKSESESRVDIPRCDRQLNLGYVGFESGTYDVQEIS